MKIETDKNGLRLIPESKYDAFQLGGLVPHLHSYNLTSTTDLVTSRVDMEHLFIENSEIKRLLFDVVSDPHRKLEK